MSFINTFLEKPTRVYKKRKTRADKKICTHIWLSDYEYEKVFIASKKSRQTMTQFCSQIVIQDLANTDNFSLVQHQVQARQTNVKLNQEQHEQVINLSVEWNFIPIRHAVHRVLISGLRSRGVL